MFKLFKLMIKIIKFLNPFHLVFLCRLSPYLRYSLARIKNIDILAVVIIFTTLGINLLTHFLIFVYSTSIIHNCIVT